MRLSRVAFVAVLALVGAWPALAGHYEPVGGTAQGTNGQVWTSGGPGVPAGWAAGGTASQLPGFRNRLINGDMRIDQRNAGAAQTITAGAARARLVDQFYGYSTGANVTGQRIAGTGASQFRYQFTGAAGVTAIGFDTAIEAANSYDLAGATATFSADLADSLLTSVTWTAYYANSTDAFGTLASPARTQIATGTFTVSSTLSRYSAQISMPSAAITGVEVVLTVGAQTSGTWTIGNTQLEPGASATAFEKRPIGVELPLCQRQYAKSYDFGTTPGTTATANGALRMRAYSGTYSSTLLPFPVPMRTVPSVTLYNPSTGATGSTYNNDAGTSATASLPSIGQTSAYAESSSLTASNNYLVHFVATAEILN